MIKEDDTPLHIMLADDDEDDRNFFNDAISDLKISNKLTIFKNGQDLMDYLEHPDTVLPDILFLDLNMPCKTGNECLKDIRANPKFKDISIAIYSTSSSDKDIEETFVGGANIYIKKPNDFSKLKKSVERSCQFKLAISYLKIEQRYLLLQYLIKNKIL